MRAILIALGVLVTVSAEAKTWSDQGCATTLISEEGGTFTLKRDGSADVVCKIASWPISEPEAQMACGDGTTRTLSIKSDTEVVFDGISMLVPSDANGVCD